MFNIATNTIAKPQVNTINNELSYLISNVGMQTIFSNVPGSFARFNLPLVEKIANYGPSAVPQIVNLLNKTNRDTVIAEGALVAQKLAEQKVTGYEQLYAPLARHASHPCPVVQVMIAGALRNIGEPSAVGPLSRMLYNNMHYPPNYFTFDPAEEIAGSLIELIAQRSAVNTVKMLEPRLQNIEKKLDIKA
ncbi:MAG: hypothetical protein AB1782_00200 [Cyanobacteriota bacterium]